MLKEKLCSGLAFTIVTYSILSNGDTIVVNKQSQHEKVTLQLILKMACTFHAIISCWKEPIQRTCESLLTLYSECLLVGDIEFAFTLIANYCI